MYDKANYFAILPAAVRYDPKLTARAKLLYAALTSLAVGEGIAYPSNTYIAETFDVDERTVQRLVSELDGQKYITVSFEYVKDTKEIARRLIRINPLPLLLDIPTTQALYAVIPSHILAMSELSPQAKLLYAEISAATPTDGYCSKPATFFAELLRIGASTVRRLIKELVDVDALRVEMEYKDGSREIRRRRIYLTEAAQIVEKRAEFSRIASKDDETGNSSISSQTRNSRDCGQNRGMLIFDTTSEMPQNCMRKRHGKRKKSTEKLRL